MADGTPMQGDKARAAWTRLSRWVADGCLLAALVLVLALSWQGPVRKTPLGLGEAAREALARQVGAPATGGGQEPVEDRGQAARASARGRGPG